MKKKLFKLILLAVITSTLMVSCQKENTATTKSAEMAFSLSADNPTVAIAATTNTSLALSSTAATSASITWTSAIANISAYKLEAKKNGVQVEIKSKTLTHVDILSLSPASVSAAIDTGTYKEIELNILLLKSTSADLPIIAKGTLTTAGGAVVPVEFDYNENAVIKLKAENITVDGTSNVTSKINFHLNQLFKGISSATLDAATRTNGTLLISSTINAALYNKVLDNANLAFEARAFEKHRK